MSRYEVLSMRIKRNALKRAVVLARDLGGLTIQSVAANVIKIAVAFGGAIKKLIKKK